MLLLFSTSVNAQVSESKKQELRSQLSEIEVQIEKLQDKISKTKKERRSLNGDVHILKREIEQQYLEQKALNLSMKEIEDEIGYKNEEMVSLNEELKQKKDLLEEVLKRINSYDKISWFELLLKGGDISDVFGQIQSIFQLQKQVNVFIQNINNIRNDIKNEKSVLEEKKRENIKLKSLAGLQQASLARKKAEKTSLIRKTRGSEKRYRSLVAKSKKDIQIIKQQLYKLESVGVSMSFGEAYNKAKFVGEKTGIRPAFILGLFQVESKMGTYIGGGSWQKDLYQCYISFGKRSRAEKEKKAYLEITSSLGLDPDSMPVSRALRSVGCGGAMGAAQFMPTTWMAYRNQIASLTGNNFPSPWNIEDAFMGSAIKLSNNGANTRTRVSERKAAAMYYAGSRWRRYPGQNYARQVLGWADYYQKQIDAIESGGSSAVKI